MDVAMENVNIFSNLQDLFAILNNKAASDELEVIEVEESYPFSVIRFKLDITNDYFTIKLNKITKATKKIRKEDLAYVVNKLNMNFNEQDYAVNEVKNVYIISDLEVENAKEIKSNFGMQLEDSNFEKEIEKDEVAEDNKKDEQMVKVIEKDEVYTKEEKDKLNKEEITVIM